MVLRGGDWAASTTWLHIKLLLVAILVAYHLYLGHVVARFKNDSNSRGHVYYRWLNEFPVLILIIVVLLAVVKTDVLGFPIRLDLDHLEFVLTRGTVRATPSQRDLFPFCSRWDPVAW